MILVFLEPQCQSMNGALVVVVVVALVVGALVVVVALVVGALVVVALVVALVVVVVNRIQ